MKKKIVIGCIIIIFMLVTISLVTAVNIPSKKTEQKNSPLFEIRAKKAVNNENTKDLVKIVFKRCFTQRIFLTPLKFSYINTWSEDCTSGGLGCIINVRTKRVFCNNEIKIDTICCPSSGATFCPITDCSNMNSCNFCKDITKNQITCNICS